MMIEILAYVSLCSVLALCGYGLYLFRRLHRHLAESEKELAEFKHRRKREGYGQTVAALSQTGK